MIDDKLKEDGKEYAEMICKECKEKVIEQMKSLNKLDALFPKKALSKFTNILCLKCHRKVVKAMKKKQGIK